MAGYFYDYDDFLDGEDDYNGYHGYYDIYDLYNDGDGESEMDDDDDDVIILSDNGRNKSSHSPIMKPRKKKTPKDNIRTMQLERFEVFKTQDQENGYFDCVLEIDGKKLYVHKYFLATSSEYFRANLSDRWSNGEVIKIEHPDYTYETIYELICFIYSCECKITKDNVFVLTDMSEFYGIELLKEYCIEFLMNMDIAIEDIEKIYELADRYSLDGFIRPFKGSIKKYMNSLVDSERFLNYKKPFIKFVSVIEKSSKLEVSLI
jgi:hypothetical protein